MSAVDDLISSYLATECNEEMFVFLSQNQHIIRYIKILNNNDVNCICSKEKKSIVIFRALVTVAPHVACSLFTGLWCQS